MKRVTLLFLLCLSLGICSAWAGTTGSTNPNDFQDPVDWCVNYGCNGQQLGTPQTWISAGGSTGLVGLVSSQNMQILQQGVSWNGNFAPGMGLIYNGVDTLGNNPGGILMSFNTPVFGAGAYIQDDPFGAFTATIQLFDSGFNLLGSFSAPGNSDQNPGTALFIGAFDSSADVSYALFDTNDDNFAIGTARLKTSQQGTTPEPSTLLLVGPSMLGLASVLRRRLSRKSQEVL